MKRYLYLSFSIYLLAVSPARAQSGAQTSVDYDLAAETAVGTGDFTAYQLTANRHHVLATRPNTAYLRAKVSASHQLADDWTLSGAVDAVGAVHADHKAYLQQCYLNLRWKDFFVEAGTREQAPILRNATLSSGAFIKGNNAKPIPQIHLGTNGFWTVPYTRDWLQISFDFGYGKLLDSHYRENAVLSRRQRQLALCHRRLLPPEAPLLPH